MERIIEAQVAACQMIVFGVAFRILFDDHDILLFAEILHSIVFLIVTLLFVYELSIFETIVSVRRPPLD
jgi:hypothetical protein